MRTFSPPRGPTTLAEAGLERSFAEELVLKHLFFLGEFKMTDVAERVKLPVSLVELMLEDLHKEKLLEIRGAASYTKTSYLFRLTEAGRRKGQDLLDLCRYTGPAPVSIKEYRRVVQDQTVKGALGGEDTLKSALSHLVLNDSVLRRLGPAIISGQAVFIYGPSGNGKTSIAEAIGRALPEEVYIPYAVQVGGQVISVFDPACHEVVAPGEGGVTDSRWVLIKRPVINVGGELTLRMLELSFDPASKYYEGSLQMKANNGVFILDDFGRQQIDPLSILNRWLVPLERQVDHITLQTGMKVLIPFDVLVIISTDLEPKDLVHEAFLRRLHYKIRIDRPTEDEYLAIFKAACQKHGIEFREEVYRYLNEHWYSNQKVERSACHPRDLISLILTDSSFYDRPPQLTLESVTEACRDYFA
ncbi:ATPase [Geomonas sp. Red32]|uniref:ATPase n=1 Tax=Geomonas sp. Red32 TaxID=2912856 RepID=UPI00202CB769|nr:ATPase [Geomonas sp. Red32]MCM0082878.1 ATPase [Geomonas sp. Red32]